MEMYNVKTALFCGSRYWENTEIVAAGMALLPQDTLIIQGGANGADSIARGLAISSGRLGRTYEAQWKELLGKKTGRSMRSVRSY
jgi:hypothetical protein